MAVPAPQALTEATLYAGTAGCALALALLSAHGFAPGGRLPVLAAALFAGGALLVGVRPRTAAQSRSASGSPSGGGVA